MHPIQQFKAQYKHINPIIILAPIQRCGSTLLQRMINAGGKAIIYGENFYLSETLPRSVGDIAGNLEKKAAITTPTMEQFMQGDRGMDATTLFPDYTAYGTQVIKSFYDLLNLYQEQSEANGFKHWGIKYQMRDARGAHHFLNLLPNIRLIAINRNLMEVAKSYYARWPEQLPNEQSFAALGQRWKVHNQFMQQIKLPHLAIRYEAFMEDKEGYADRIAEAVGVKIDKSQLEKKINIHATDPNAPKAEQQDGGHYLKPKELPDYGVKVLEAML